MDIAIQDLFIIDIDNIINNKKKFLFEKQNELINNERNNEFLKDVLGDYNNYYNKIKLEKQKQYETLLFISDYIHKMNNTLNKTDYLVNESKIQRDKLIEKIEKIKIEIDKL